MNLTSVSLKYIIEIINQIAPFSLAEDWDNVGLMLGDPEQNISGIMVGLDPTDQLLEESLQSGANLIITHHPLIFRPLKNIRTDQPIGSFISKAIRNEVAVIGCHTNLDVVENGVNHILASKLGLTDLEILIPHAGSSGTIGLGITGSLEAPMPAEDLLSSICKALRVPVLSVVGTIPKLIEKVSVCGGSGSDFSEAARNAGAQIFITGEVKHSTARWAEEAGFCIIDAGHYATENLITEAFASILQNELVKANLTLPVFPAQKQENPFKFFIAKDTR